MRRSFINHVKNIRGFKSNRKFVIFSVDDYGNVRVDSPKAREQMNKSGSKIHSIFDAYDALETAQDLEALYEVLSTVSDANGNPAVFTPYTLPCNIDFERIASENYAQYFYELLPATYEKLSLLQPNAYRGAWNLWKEGIAKGLLKPQFHGREHLNLKVFKEKLRQKNKEVMIALRNRSYTSLSDSGYPSIKYTAAFAFWEFEDLNVMPGILKSGLIEFKKVFDYPATIFTPPAQQFHPSLEPVLLENGIKVIDKPFYNNQHQGLGQYKKELNYTSYNGIHQPMKLVRNVVFEPTYQDNINWVNFALDQIKTAFWWNRPAVISSHRVNFCGHISPGNRTKGLFALKQLLQKIVELWPDVEFIPACKLVDMIIKK